MKRVLTVIMVIAMLFSVMPLQDVHAASLADIRWEEDIADHEEETSGSEQKNTTDVSDDGEETVPDDKEGTESASEKETVSDDGEGTELVSEEETVSDDKESIELASEEDVDSDSNEVINTDNGNEEVLAKALKAVEDGTAFRLTAEGWVAESSFNKGDLVWLTTSSDMSGKLSVTQADVTDQSFDKAMKIKTTQKAANNWV